MASPRDQVRARMGTLLLLGATITSTLACVRGVLMVDPMPPPPVCPAEGRVPATVRRLEGELFELRVGPLPPDLSWHSDPPEDALQSHLGEDGIWTVQTAASVVFRTRCAAGPGVLEVRVSLGAAEEPQVQA